MALFSKQKTPAEIVVAQAEEGHEALDLMQRLEKVVERLGEKSDEIRGTRALKKLQQERMELEHDIQGKEEQHARERRETEHMIGLQKQRGEQELDIAKKAAEQERVAAVKQAELQVREGNLKAKEDMFEERMKAVTEGLENQITYLRTDIIKAILDRLPTFNVDAAFRHTTNGDSGRQEVLPAGDKE